MFFDMKKKEVLIVEDELIIALMLEQMTVQLNHKVVDKVVTGQGAIDRALALRPDVILMDIRLQDDIDGIEAVQKIHEHIDSSIIYITGNTDQRLKDRIQKTSYVDFLAKPINKSQLENAFDLVSQKVLQE